MKSAFFRLFTCSTSPPPPRPRNRNQNRHFFFLCRCLQFRWEDGFKCAVVRMVMGVPH